LIIKHFKPPQTTSNHFKPPQTTSNHFKPPQTTSNHFKPLQTTSNHLMPPKLPLLILTIATLAYPSKAQTEVQSTPALEQQILAIIEHPDARFYYSTRKIPRRLLAKAKAVSKQEEIDYDGVYKLANPGKPFRHGCTIEKGLLSRRMVFLARLDNAVVLCYERGGRSHNLLISYAEISGRQMSYYNISLHDITPCTEYTNLEQIKLALKEGRVHANYLNGSPTERRHVPF
jgi:hypothetical protein